MISEFEGRVRTLNLATGIITRVVGFDSNFSPLIGTDADGSLFIVRPGLSTTIHRISASAGVDTIVAGGGSPADKIGDNGPATAADASALSIPAGGEIHGNRQHRRLFSD